ncbi:division plane positioning ATPase MipZ [Pontixanthobacter sp.]|uniref:division plane positioning ATPase MipZ n=1 Tax=Pontixanthobacter sp. TaxID=2792078 RepID=UPI003C7D5D07
MSIRHSDGEHPSVVLADICRRPEINAQIIVFANEKGGVGKSTLAFHTSIALARAGHKVLAIDLDRRQQSFCRALENRAATSRSLGIDLPSPQTLMLDHQTGAMLMQEIARVGTGTTTIIIDVAGHDSPIARRAMALADKIITPVNPTFIDLDSVAHFNAATMRFAKLGRFAETVEQLQTERHERGLSKTDWMVVKNRVRKAERLQLKRFDQALDQLPAHLGVRLLSGLTERVAYRELFMFGLTHADCADLPGMAHMGVSNTDEITRFIGEMDVASPAQVNAQPHAPKRRAPARSMKRYRKSLRTHVSSALRSRETV